MTVGIILAVDEGGGIGSNGDIPWHFSVDLAYFKRTTMGGVCIVGRITAESLINRGVWPLKGRACCVVSSTKVYPHVPTVDSIEAALEWAKRVYPNKDVWICGGANMYSAALPHIDVAHVTHLPINKNCDTTVHDVLEYLNRNFKATVAVVDDGVQFWEYQRMFDVSDLVSRLPSETTASELMMHLEGKNTFTGDELLEYVVRIREAVYARMRASF